MSAFLGFYQPNKINYVLNISYEIIIIEILISGTIVYFLICKLIFLLQKTNLIKIRPVQFTLRPNHKKFLLVFFIIILSTTFSYQSLNTIKNAEYEIESNVVSSANYSKIFMVINQNSDFYLLVKDVNTYTYEKYLLSNMCNTNCTNSFFKLLISEKNNEAYIWYSPSINEAIDLYMYNLETGIGTNSFVNSRNFCGFINFLPYNCDFNWTSYENLDFTIQPIFGDKSYYFNNMVFPNNSVVLNFWVAPDLSNVMFSARINDSLEYLLDYKSSLDTNTNNSAVLLLNKEYILHSAWLSHQYVPLRLIKWDLNNSLVYYSCYDNGNSSIYIMNLKTSEVTTLAVIPGEYGHISIGQNNSYILATDSYQDTLHGYNLKIYSINNSTATEVQNLIIQNQFDGSWDNSRFKELIFIYKYVPFTQDLGDGATVSGDKGYPKILLFSYNSATNTVTTQTIVNQIPPYDEDTLLSPIYLFFLLIFIVMLLILLRSILKNSNRTKFTNISL